MAFVSESKLPESLAVKTAAVNVGPGQYDIDSLQHKQLMAAIYPKKSAPFNSTEKRTKEIPQKNKVPGKLPGRLCYLYSAFVLRSIICALF